MANSMFCYQCEQTIGTLPRLLDAGQCNILQMLIDKFSIKLISTPDED